jgi:hypothetical protein
VAWQLRSHGLMMAVAGGSCSGGGHVMEAAAVVLRWLCDMAWRLQSHGLMVAVAVGGGSGRIVSRWLHGIAVVGGHMARWWWWWSR